MIAMFRPETMWKVVYPLTEMSIAGGDLGAGEQAGA